MRGDRYNSYRGRSRFATVVKVLIVVLVLALLAALAALFFLERYIVYSSDGVRLELPFFQKEEPPEEPGRVVVETAPPTASPTPEVEEERFRAVLLDRSALTDGTAAEQTAAAGANAAIFDMKADDGALAYASQLPLALEMGVSDGAADSDAISALNDGELYTVARVACFRDNTAPRWRNSMALRTAQGNWRDATDTRWLSIQSPAAREYVIGVCRELAELGFDELLLDCCGFPTQGDMGRLQPGENYDPDDLTGPVEAFFTELETALAGFPDLRVSVVTNSSVLSGQADGTGQTLELLEKYDVRLLAPEGDGSLPLDSAVPILDRPGASDASWAVLTVQTEQ